LEQSTIIHSQPHDTVPQRCLSDSHPNDRIPSIAYNASIPVATSSASNPGSVEDNPAFSPNGTDALVHSSTGFISDLESLFDTTNALGWSDLFNSNSEYPMPDFGDQMYDDPLSLLAHVANHPPSDALPSELYTTSTMENQRSDKPYHGSASAGVRTLPLHSADNEMSEPEILEDAQILLKHFKNVLIPQFSPLPMTAKSPWEILVCSAAVQTYADMTYLEGHNIKHASKANFFAILACSAHHITKTQLIFDALPLERGLRVLEYASLRAKRHMQESLAFETSGPQRAKYKDQLMAIFSLIALAVRPL
jgi:arginine metabolism regulation protein II